MLRTIPVEALPASMPQEVKAALSKHRRPRRPAVQATHAPQPVQQPIGSHKIAEIKCCRDSDPTQQLEKATSQIKQVTEAIKQHDPDAKVHELPLLIGVAGAIYNVTQDSLETLGVKASSLKRVMSLVHRAVIDQLHKIYKTKLLQSKQINQPRKQKRKK